MFGVKRIVLTGGPCAGKSTALTEVIKFLNENGYLVVSVPEAATELIGNGITPDMFVDLLKFQEILIRKIISNEEFFGRVLQEIGDDKGKDLILICDRGVFDGRAYVKDIEAYDRLLSRAGMDYARYDEVIHLCSAANGAEDFYTTSNNIARRETVEEACILDTRTMQAYSGHQNLTIIDNNGSSFQEKMNRVLKTIARSLDMPEPFVLERKWAVNGFQIPRDAVHVRVRQFYLKDKSRLRVAKYPNGEEIYTHTQKSDKPGVQRIRTEHSISSEEFGRFLENAVCGLEKDRYCFLHENQYFRLDVFTGTNSILEVQVSDLESKIVFPDFLEIFGEVTHDPHYYNANIAERFGIVENWGVIQ